MVYLPPQSGILGLCHSLVKLLNHGGRPPAVDGARIVFPRVEHPVPPFVSLVRERRGLGNPFAKLGRNEGDSFRIDHGNITRHGRCLADANRDVDAHEHQRPQSGRIDRTSEHFEALDLFETRLLAERVVQRWLRCEPGQELKSNRPHSKAPFSPKLDPADRR